MADHTQLQQFEATSIRLKALATSTHAAGLFCQPDVVYGRPVLTPNFHWIRNAADTFPVEILGYNLN